MSDSAPRSGTSFRHRFRLAARLFFLAAAVFAAWPAVPSDWLPLSVPAASPFVAAAGGLVARTLGVTALFALPTFLLCLVLRRGFCHWVCPTGLMLDMARHRHSAHTARILNKIPPLGKWLFIITFAGAAFGCPLFLFLDPLCIFNGAFALGRLPATLASLAGGAILPILLLASFLLPGIWCHRLCPLGALQDFLSLPRRWLRRALEHPPSPGAGNGDVRVVGRRYALACCAGLGAAAALSFLRGKKSCLRPPGAVDESVFPSLCARCGNCSRACPSRIIHPDLGDAGITGLLAPVLEYGPGRCLEDCVRCGRVCPSGAIRRLSLEDKKITRIGLARSNPRTCLLARGKDCSLCLDACPYGALDRRKIAEGVFSPSADKSLCVGCGSCEACCPVKPQPAIRVEALE